MPKKRPSSVVHLPLSAVLGTESKVVVIRALLASSVPLSCQELAERGGMAYRSITLALRDFVAVGLAMQVGGRRERLYALNASHRLMPSLQAVFRAESDFFPALRAEVAAVVRTPADGLLGVAVVGPVASGRDQIGEAVHVVVITDSPESVRRWGDRFVAASTGLRQRFGLTLRVTTYDHTTVREMWAKRTVAAERIVNQAIRITGAALIDLVRDESSV